MPLSNAAFYALLKQEPPPCDVKLSHVWQFAKLLQACPDSKSATALTRANPRLAKAYAEQEAVYEALTGTSQLEDCLGLATSDDEVRQMLEQATPQERAEHMAALALAEYDQDALSARYVELILGETL
jgi:hypothetical protein